MSRNEKGITLVELLAVLVLLSVILIFGINIFLSMQKQVDFQTNETHTQTNERLAINIITKEIRKADSVEVSNSDELIIDGEYKFWLDGTDLKKNDEHISSEINEFKVSKDDNQVLLKVGRLPETVIYIRE